jgi:hypothetical protein
MEQDQGVKDPEQEEEWVEVAVARAEVVVAGAEAVGLQQARAVIASVPTVVKGHPINWGAPVMSSNAQSVGPL